VNKSLETLIGSMNAQLFVLTQNGHALFDADNRDCYISGIRYCSEDDKIIFEMADHIHSLESENEKLTNKIENLEDEMENLQNINEKLESRIRVFNNQGR
jgi:molecular chaperone GrpE (heat shock protein)